MGTPPTTLILAVVQPEDAGALQTALTETGCGATYLTARGGFLNRHAVAVLVLASTIDIPRVIAAVRATCSRRTALVTPVAEAEFGYVPEPMEVEIGGAVIFGLPVAAVTRWGSPERSSGGGRPSSVKDGRSLAPGVIAMTISSDQEAPMFDTEPTKLLVAVVPDRVANRVVAALIERRFGATTVGSTGGFLRRGNTTVLTGVPADQAEEAARLIESTCRQAGEADPAEGGIAFALDVHWRLRL